MKLTNWTICKRKSRINRQEIECQINRNPKKDSEFLLFTGNKDKQSKKEPMRNTTYEMAETLSTHHYSGFYL